MKIIKPNLKFKSLKKLCKRWILYPADKFSIDKRRNSTFRSNTLYDTYTVKSGDTLWSISREMNMVMDELRGLNGLTGDTIYVNQILRII
ncbi:MAG: LysM peptidoglycan-binding domain-containing protein [Anaeromicrobium sp.]|uniref:LysM peptidoglycan-binding domain-containing protein n=1 Tax=Anaeromicrobium sp. TaxID=1929132 RepID=UPI0025DCEAD5|nr:LysM peptidoglycan-binding domain-containing protein [Anaeromicrobium sp.]MCT4593630.1 LysM peptidoglycan-binding domain-containing protein [Anaeromicrobium sp.]